MKIDIQTSGIGLDEDVRTQAERRLRFALGAAGDRVRSVVVRLADENGPRGGVDKLCVIRAVLSGTPLVVIEQREADLRVAIDRAADRVGRTVSRRLERLADRRSNAAFAGRAFTDDNGSLPR